MSSIPSSLRNRGPKAAQHAQPSQPKELSFLDSAHLNFYSFLSIAQQQGVEFMPISWEPARDLLGLGASGRVNQSLISIETSLAFKRPASFGNDKNSRQQMFRDWLLEISILRSPKILQHPNIIELEGIAWEVIDEGSSIVPVLVYQKAQLGTLRTVVEANAMLSLNQKVKLCWDLASALSTLHSLNVVHGDIKPGNVVVFSKSSESQDMVAKMIDFGYSCFGMEDEDMVQITGTPLWCAPETDGDEVTFLSAKKMDVYSFGLKCRIEEGLLKTNTRKRMHLFIEQIKEADDPQELLSDAISQTASLGEKEAPLLHNLLTKVLCKDPTSRSCDWADFIQVLSKIGNFPEDLGAHLQFCEFHVSKESPLTLGAGSNLPFKVLDSLADFDIADFRIRKFVTKTLEETMYHSRCPKCSANAAFERLLCQKIGFGDLKIDDLSDSWLLKSGRSAEDLESEVRRFQTLGHQGLSGRMQQLVGGYSLDLPYVYQLHGCLGLAESECKKEIENRQAIVSADHPSLLRLKYSLGHIYEALDRWKQAEKIYGEVLEARTRIFGSNASSTLICEVKVGSCLAKQGELDRSEQMLRQALQKFETSLGEGHRSSIAAMGHLGSVLMSQGRFNDADEILKKQLLLSTCISGENHVDTLSISSNLAQNKFASGNWEEAETIILGMIKTQKEVLEFDDREVMTGMHNLCRLYIEQGRYDLAKRLQEQETKIYKKSNTEGGLGALLSLTNLGLVLAGQGELDEAAEVQYRSANALEQLMGLRHPDTLSSWSDLALIYNRQSRFDEARKVQERVVLSMDTAPVLSQTYAPGFLAGLANIYCASGRWNEAEETFLKALKLAEAIFGSKHPWTLYTRASMATLYKSQHRLDEAKGIEENVLEKMEEELGPSHEKTLVLMRNLSITHRFLGNLDEARSLQNKISSLRTNSSSKLELLEDKLNLSNILCDQDEYEGAQMMQEEVSKTLEALKGAEDSDTMNSRYHLAQTYCALGLFKEAERIHNDDIPRHIKLYSEEHDLTLKSRSALAVVWTRQGRWKDGERQFEEIFRTYAKMGFQDHHSALKARLGMALAKSEDGQHDGAIMILDEIRSGIREGRLHVDEALANEANDVFCIALMNKLTKATVSGVD